MNVTEIVARAMYEAAVEAENGAEVGAFEAETWLAGFFDVARLATAAIEAHKAHLSASGLVIVPREPTEAMYRAGESLTDEFFKLGAPVAADSIWHRMIDGMIDAALSPKEG